MRTYDRILAPVDFSPLSKIAAEEAVVVSERHECELIFLHVIENFPEHLTHFRLEDMDPEHFIIEQAKKDLIALCEQLGTPDATQEVRLTSGSAKAEIVKFASDQAVGLIIIGARGRHGLIDILSGSTATGVVRAAPCDVLVIHEQSGST